MARVFVLVLLVLGGACAPARVQLADPPKPDAPLEERRAFYEEHRPVVVRTDAGLGAFRATAFVQLRNGARIYHPADLLLHVDEGSPTAEAVRRLETAEQQHVLWHTASLTVLLVGLAGALTSLVAFPEAPMLVMLSSNASALIALPMILLAMHFQSRTAMERETAFLTYDRSLRERIALPPTPGHGPGRDVPGRDVPDDTGPSRDPPPLLQERDPKSAATTSPDAPRDPLDVLCATLPALDPAPPATSAPSATRRGTRAVVSRSASAEAR